jgi:hypothetical protein
MSSRGKTLTNLAFSGKVPVVGDLVYVDYSRGTPIILTSDTNGNDTGSIEATGRPIISAPIAISNNSVETVAKRYGNMLYRGDWDSAIDYLLNDVVYDGTSLYLCILENNNNIPPDDTYWIAIGGSDTDPILPAHTAIFNRKLTADLVLTDGQSLVTTDYIDASVYNIELQGDAELVIL